MGETKGNSSRCVLALSLYVILVGCSQTSSTPMSVGSRSETAPLTIVDGGEPSESERQAMLAAKDELFNRLSSRLMEVMGGQGPAAAIAVCQKEATQIATEVGVANQLRIGRTGVRLRNQQNTPPVWAESLVEAATDSPQFVRFSDGSAGALLTIKLQSQCLMCHGPQDQIAPIIKDQLAKLYPKDEATGFREGDLRGGFWIEVPAS